MIFVTDAINRLGCHFAIGILYREAQSTQSDAGWRRSFLIRPRRVLASVRRALLARLGLVASRGLRGLVAATSNSASRARASARFLACSRKRWAVMVMTPSLSSRESGNARSRVLTRSGRLGLLPTSKRSFTALATLLTFWPP